MRRMSLLASTINGAGYVLSNGEDKDNGNGFEVSIMRTIHLSMLTQAFSSRDESDGHSY